MMSFNNIKQRIYISIDTGVQLQFTWNRCIYGEYLLPSKNQRNDLILTVCSKLERCILANIHGKVKPVLIAISYHVFNGRDIADMVLNTNQSINQSINQVCISSVCPYSIHVCMHPSSPVFYIYHCKCIHFSLFFSMSKFISTRVMLSCHIKIQ